MFAMKEILFFYKNYTKFSGNKILDQWLYKLKYLYRSIAEPLMIEMALLCNVPSPLILKDGVFSSPISCKFKY